MHIIVIEALTAPRRLCRVYPWLAGESERPPAESFATSVARAVLGVHDKTEASIMLTPIGMPIFHFDHVSVLTIDATTGNSARNPFWVQLQGLSIMSNCNGMKGAIAY